ncbi:MAG: C1 family peptidase [Erysipelotrichaceae bacterium]|nr:C1 family peptidase [Erysipelotrichaceae bacterium]
MRDLVGTTVSADDVKEYLRDFNSNEAYKVAANASNSVGIDKAAVDYKALRRNDTNFSIELKQGSITNQESSGRCWLFAATNVFRYEFMKKNKVEDFELSQAYLHFWDKLEKANFYLNTVIELADEPVEGRLFSWINRDPLGDGGQWDMIVNLVNKYGVCPKYAYPDSANARDTWKYTQLMTKRLREDAVVLRKAVKDGLSRKELLKTRREMLKEIYRILVIALGEPPVTFDLVVHDKDEKLIEERDITPRQFFRKYIGIKIEDYVSLINAPSHDKPFNAMYTVKHLGNVVEGEPVRYLNLPIEEVKKAVIAQLKDGHPVWFGSDCGQGSEDKSGTFDEATAAIAEMCGIKHWFTKGDKLTYGESAMNHAMVFEGVDLKDGKPLKWKIENSWGKKAGRDGYYVASDQWFDDYVFQAVVDKNYLSRETRKLLEQPLVELEPWDPMGTLAD